VARRAYATQILRHWYYGTRMYERSALVVLSRDGLVEIAVGRQTRMVFDEVVAHHFAVRAMEMLARHNASETEPSRALLQETAQKLIFYISFTVRSRTQATVVSMRSMSMFMMFFMMITISATKQQQARRYAELYGYRHDPYGRGFYLGPGIHGRADFWEEFESGRRGGVDEAILERAEQERNFFRLQLLSIILANRQQQSQSNEDDEEEEDEEEQQQEEVEEDEDEGEEEEEPKNEKLEKEELEKRRISSRTTRVVLHCAPTTPMTFAQVLSAHRQSPAQLRWQIFQQTLHALAYCHSVNVIHRDLKPVRVPRLVP
jgi:hypothetical protein